MMMMMIMALISRVASFSRNGYMYEYNIYNTYYISESIAYTPFYTQMCVFVGVSASI